MRKEYLMKRMFTCLLLFCFVNLSAQEFHFIPKVGINLANITNTEEGEMKVGLNVGWAGELKLTEKLLLNLALCIPCRGY